MFRLRMRSSMIQIYFKKHWHVHFFNRLSIYYDPYMKNINYEYWNGFNRKKFAEFGTITVWVREDKP